MTRDEDIDDLAVLVDGAVDVPPDPVDLDVGLVDEPPVADLVHAGTSRVDEQRSESLHPPVQGHVNHLDSALRQEFPQIAV